MRRTLAENVALATQAVCDSFPAGTRVTRPGGGFLLWVELPKPINTLDLYERALQHSITFAPGPLFSAKGSYRNFLRLSVADGSDRTRQAIVKLGRLASV
jgi:DNA-binding transcriptional MocR family regulator